MSKFGMQVILRVAVAGLLAAVSAMVGPLVGDAQAATANTFITVAQSMTNPVANVFVSYASFADVSDIRAKSEGGRWN